MSTYHLRNSRTGNKYKTRYNKKKTRYNKTKICNKNSRNKSKSKTKIKSRYKSIKYYLAGSPTTNTTIPCSMCNKTTTRSESLTPLQCLNKHGQQSHRICKDCWFNEETGFALENKKHSCPGCLTNLPLNPLPKSNTTNKPSTTEPIVIST
jgi:hypothetical protein